MTAERRDGSDRRRVALVTGGTAGVGRAVVRALAAAEWDVAVLARGADGLAGAVADVEARGGRALALAADVADPVAVDAAAARAEAELGPLEAWVNVAFAGSIGFLDDISPEEFERVTRVTYLGCVNGTRAALRHMRPRDRGVIVQVGSALAFRGIPLQAAYCGAKHAVHGFTESVRVELAHSGSGVRVAEVHLPAVNTPQFDWVLSRGMEHHAQPVPPIVQPEAVARVIARTCERPRPEVFVGVPTWLTVWGNRLAPGVVDRVLARTNVSAQQNPAKGPPPVESNLWEPLPGDRGAHGAFDDVAHDGGLLALPASDAQLVGGAGVAALAAGMAIASLARRRRRPARTVGSNPGRAAHRRLR